MIRKVLNVRQQVVYQDTETKESFRRVLGGLAWPALPERGCLVVVAEYWSRNDGLKARPLKILSERSALTIADLHRFCLELRKECQVGSWLTNLTQKQEVQLFFKQNRDRELQSDVYLQAAPYTRAGASLGIYTQLILELVQVGRKILSFGEASHLAGQLMNRTAEEMQQPAEKFPQNAALGYAVAELVMQEPVDQNLVRQPPVVTWDRHQFAGAGRR